MAAAARPGPSDARVPCPLCGGLIHPIAGKCKHCKADLSAYRATRPAAGAPLPPLLPPVGAAPTNGHNGHSYAPAPVALPVPPARGYAPAKPSAWRSWPIVVIVVAVVAIVAAVVVMAWPTSHTRDGTHALQAPPAPERMPTAPEIRAAPTPPPSTPSSDPRPQPPDNPALHDPGAALGDDSTPAPRAADAPSGVTRANPIVMVAVIGHFCRRMDQCGTKDAASRNLCSSLRRQGLPPLDPSCMPIVRRCLEYISKLACDDASPSGFAAISSQPLCAEALECGVPDDGAAGSGQP